MIQASLPAPSARWRGGGPTHWHGAHTIDGVVVWMAVALHRSQAGVVERHWIVVRRDMTGKRIVLQPCASVLPCRPDGGPYGSTEACLKFWDATSGGGSSEAGSGGFLLNTRVDEPHRDHVACLAYHPTRHVAVTTGGSGAESEYKLWVREQRSAPGSGRRGAGRVVSSHWRCLSTGGYKGLPLGPAAFSPGDGSVLAVAAHSRVTLWDSSSSALAAVLPAPPADEHRVASGPSAAAPLTQLAFVPGTPFLAAASATSLTVYNILTAAVHWSLPYGAVSISADPLYGLLAAALPATPPLPAEAPAAADAAPSASKQAGNAAAAAAPVVIPVPPSCHVLVLDPRDATPRYHCHVPGARAVHLAHLASSSAAAAADGKGCSPLLMLRDNRQYSIAALEGGRRLTCRRRSVRGEDAVPSPGGRLCPTKAVRLRCGAIAPVTCTLRLNWQLICGAHLCSPSQAPKMARFKSWPRRASRWLGIRSPTTPSRRRLGNKQRQRGKRWRGRPRWKWTARRWAGNRGGRSSSTLRRTCCRRPAPWRRRS